MGKTEPLELSGEEDTTKSELQETGFVWFGEERELPVLE